MFKIKNLFLLSLTLFLIGGFLPPLWFNGVAYFISKLFIPVGLLGIFVFGFWWFLDKVTDPKTTTDKPIGDRILALKTPEELVDFIDKVSNSCLIAVNNVWLQENWNKNSDSEKIIWVTNRFNLLREQISQSNENAIQIIDAIQTADKKYTRSNNKN